jgi:hypothetical protein
MKPVMLILFMSLAGTFVFGQTESKGCGNFKSGEFAYRDSANNIINVKRKGGKQQEEDKKNKIITKFNIRWTSDCAYELTQTWSNVKAKRKQNRSVIRVIITKANGDDSYEFHCACKEREEKRNSGTMVRLSE